MLRRQVTRVDIPAPLPTELPRAELLTLIESQPNLSIVALAAPSGYGKSMLLAQLIRRSKRAAVWISPTPDQADPETLLRRLQSQLQALEPGAAFTEWERAQQNQVASEAAMRALCHDLSGFATDCDIILDGCETLSVEAWRCLSALLENLPDGHRVLFSAFDLEHVRIARLVAQGSALVLSETELRFREEESRQLLQHRLDALEVHQRLKGWPIGIGLLAASSTSSLSPEKLVHEVLERLPSAVRAAIPEAAVLERWREDWSKQLGCALPSGWLQAVKRAGLPLEVIGDAECIPHQLVLQTLERELSRDPERHLRLHLAAAEHAAARNEPLRAFDHAVTAGDTVAAQRIIRAPLMRFEQRSEYLLIRRTLERLRFEDLEPDLAEVLGTAWLESGEVARGSVYLQNLLDGGQATPRGLIALCKLAFRRGQYERQLTLARQGARMGGASRADCERLEAWALIGLGRAPEAVVIGQRAIDTATDAFALGLALILTHNAYLALGQREQCVPLLQQALEVYTTLDVPLRCAGLRNELADLHRLGFRFADALAELESARQSLGGEELEVSAYLAETRADVLFWMRQFEESLVAYDEGIRLAERLGLELLAARLQLKKAECALHLEQIPVVNTALRAAQRFALSETPSLEAAWAFVRGLMSFETDPLEAQRLFTQACASYEATHAPRARAFLCELARRRGTLNQADAEALLEAVTVFGTDRVLQMDIALIAPVLIELRRRGWAREQFGTLLDQTAPGLTIDPPIALVAATKTALEILVLGQQRVRIAGADIDVPLKKSVELLVRLAIFGPSSREQLMNAVWDGSRETRHAEYFKTAMRRLRHALSSHPAVSFNPIRFDSKYELAEEFELHCDAAQLRGALEGTDAEALEASVGHSLGVFMPDFESEWVEDYRAELRGAYFEACRLSATRCAPTAAPRAERYWQRALEVEPLDETCLLELMRSLMARDELPLAQHAFDRYKRILRSELGEVPSAELVRRLRQLGFSAV
jgi:LuxR family transcriptional regulator, maltose regulon positive regulatory protein